MKLEQALMEAVQSPSSFCYWRNGLKAGPHAAQCGTQTKQKKMSFCTFCVKNFLATGPKVTLP